MTTAEHPRLTSAQIDRLIAGTRIGGSARASLPLQAAKDYLCGRCRSIQEAADRHGIHRQSAARVIYSIVRLAEHEARRAGYVHVGVLVPEAALGELEAWVAARGGEVVR